MKEIDQVEEYLIPSARCADLSLESSFLQSNLEPIEGGDDPDIEW